MFSLLSPSQLTLRVEIGVQILIVFVGGAAFQVTPLRGREWGISLALGVVSIPLGALIRLMPNGPHEKLFKRLGFLGKQDKEILPTSSEEAQEVWVGAVEAVRDNLGTFANLRGGRMRSSSFVGKSRLSRMGREPRSFEVYVILRSAHFSLFGLTLVLSLLILGNLS